MIIFMNSTSATFTFFGNQQHSLDDRITDVRIFARALPHVGVLPYSPVQSSSLCQCVHVRIH